MVSQGGTGLHGKEIWSQAIRCRADKLAEIGKRGGVQYQHGSLVLEIHREQCDQ
jgi:hypothetical protein